MVNLPTTPCLSNCRSQFTGDPVRGQPVGIFNRLQACSYNSIHAEFRRFFR